MTTGADDPLQRMLKKLADDRKKIEESLDGPADDSPLTAQGLEYVERIKWVLAAALAHSQGSMPWRARAPTPADSQWVKQVCSAVQNKVARPPHPDSDIEQILLDALPT